MSEDNLARLHLNVKEARERFLAADAKAAASKAVVDAIQARRATRETDLARLVTDAAYRKVSSVSCCQTSLLAAAH